MPNKQQLFLHRFRNSWRMVLGSILVVPLIVWSQITPLSERFSDMTSIFDSLGQITGITGTLLFSWSLILSYRNRITEIIFGGLDKVYRIHHLSGMYGLFLLLLHPLFLSVTKLSYSAEYAMNFFTPFKTSTAVDFGIFSLLFFMILIGITLFGVIFSYQSLKKFHMFLGAAFLLGAVHGFLIESDINENVFLRVWVLGFVILGLCCYVAYTFLKKITVPRKLFTISDVQKKEGGVTQVSLVPMTEGIVHLPGQFCFFSFVNSSVVKNNEAHPFTVSSWKNDGSVVISVKTLGDFTESFAQEKVGVLVEVEGPFGEFSYGYGCEKQVWIAGGIGVTPFASFAEHIVTQKDFIYDVDFFYSVKTKNDDVFNDLFNKVSELHPSFKYYCVPSDTEGYVSGEMIVQKVSDIFVRDIFMCGPPLMMNSLEASLEKLDVKQSNIHSELFSLLK
ncbi:MAG: ferric reductase-like transmembrane domain-containing protein [Candidatus Pacebacteria bacterium]|nr:ferric reductase-like transmembrane domain-containing protein [Candidatus Paceibacterota bacterium]